MVVVSPSGLATVVTWETFGLVTIWSFGGMSAAWAGVTGASRAAAAATNKVRPILRGVSTRDLLAEQMRAHGNDPNCQPGQSDRPDGTV
ncbi:hypothetical protein Pta02_29250 [Planobispora takensis]|uniref:Uncharacterized protein n=1 Tax=Planobispora takensis TaxID=1367882 RepID=A0A8J3SUU7_9ACTN|nr:hypothetical protein Pta02_29250 [Planobispora takensis]